MGLTKKQLAAKLARMGFGEVVISEEEMAPGGSHIVFPNMAVEIPLEFRYGESKFCDYRAIIAKQGKWRSGMVRNWNKGRLMVRAEKRRES